jgi:outer membrane lipoprotein LolB
MIKIGFILLLSVLISACATSNRSPALNQDIAWPKRETQLQAITQWGITGRIGILTADQSFSAHFNWTQKSHNYTINVFGPLGIDNNILQGDQNQFTLTTAKGKQYHAPTPENLMQEQLGWALPISQLYSWVRGIPAPENDFTAKYDSYHHIKQLTQSGWLITFNAYQNTDGIDLPQQITMNQADYTITLIIRQWNNQSPTDRYEPPFPD